MKTQSLFLIMKEIFKNLQVRSEGKELWSWADLGLNFCPTSAIFESLSKPFYLPKPRFPHLYYEDSMK